MLLLQAASTPVPAGAQKAGFLGTLCRTGDRPPLKEAQRVPDEREEGWYTDPFGRHEARWMSDGSPTKLVRDGDAESYEDPPDEEPTVTPTRIAEEPVTDGNDLLRSDDPERGSLHDRMQEAGQFGATWGAHIALQPQQDEE
jgi:hypothetical protein